MYFPPIIRFTIKFQVPRSRLLPLPNRQTLHPASPVVRLTPPPQAPPSPSAPLPDPSPTTLPRRPPLLPRSHVPHPDVTPVTSPQSRHPAIHPQSLRRRPALLRSRHHWASPGGTSRARTPRLRAPRPLQTPLRPPLPPRM